MGITIKDIARMGNTSIATVSRVLGNKPGVSEPTRVRIREIIDQTGYRPSIVAQNLALRKSLNLGFIASSLVNPFYVDIFRQIERLSRTQGFHMLLMDSEMDVEREIENVELMRQHQVEGLIIVPIHDYDTTTSVDHLLRLKLDKFPFVLFGMVDGYGFDFVTTEEHDASFRLGTYLLELGHKKFAFIGAAPNNRCANARAQGLKDALNGAGLELPENCILRLDDDWFKNVRELLTRKDRPTALVLANDTAALYVLQIVRELGMTVPKDLSIGSYGGERVASSLVQPGLTTFTENLEELSRLCYKTLIRRMEEPETPPQQFLVPPRFTIRQSAGPCSIL